jgi:hypothetical protein
MVAILDVFISIHLSFMANMTVALIQYVYCLFLSIIVFFSHSVSYLSDFKVNITLLNSYYKKKSHFTTLINRKKIASTKIVNYVPIMSLTILRFFFVQK